MSLEYKQLTHMGKHSKTLTSTVISSTLTSTKTKLHCSLCAKSFNYLENLKKHERRMHLQVRSECPYCHRGFKNLGDHKAHCHYKRYIENENGLFTQLFHTYYPIIELLYRHLFPYPQTLKESFEELKLIFAKAKDEHHKRTTTLNNVIVKTKDNDDETAAFERLLLKFSVHGVEQGSFPDKRKIDAILDFNDEEDESTTVDECEGLFTFNKTNFNEVVMKKKLLDYVKKIFKGEDTDLYSCPYCSLIFQDVKQHLLTKRSCRFFKKEIKNCIHYDEQITFVAKFFSDVYTASPTELINTYHQDKQRSYTQQPLTKEKEIRQMIKDFSNIVSALRLNEREHNITLSRKVLSL